MGLFSKKDKELSLYKSFVKEMIITASIIIGFILVCVILVILQMN